MKISEQWLREFVSPTLNTQELSAQITMLGLEVDGLLPVAGDFHGVVVGHVIHREQHPDADRLSLCRVDVGEAEPLQIVCGAANVRQGLKVAVIKVGGALADFKIKKAKLRGVESHGMICSAKELGLAQESDGILELAEDAPVGKDFRDYLHLNDHIIDIDLTPNRGDCLSVLGVARDVAAKNKLAISEPESKQINAKIKDVFPVNIIEENACSRYVGRVIRNIKLDAKTPLWMQEKLRRSSIRSIHPVVDIMNFVMLECGQPMHAFDLQKLNSKIEIRYAKKNEKIKLLDEQIIELNENALIIADNKSPLALAGVMGGFDSAVTEVTQDLFLEAAHFEKEGIAKTARKFGLHTDSSHRFERGVDFELPVHAVERAAELVLEICGGEAGPVIEESKADFLPKRNAIQLRQQQIHRVLGIKFDDFEVVSILEGLGLQVESNKAGWMVTPPSFRFDMEIEVDLIEELARLRGYENIPTQSMFAEWRSHDIKEHQLPELRLKQILSDMGYSEAITYSFVDEKLAAKIEPKLTALKLTNPISSDMAVMRTSLWPGLLKAQSYNQNRQAERIRLFEMGLCFRPEKNELVQQPKCAMLLSGSVLPRQWGAKERPVDFYDAKGDVEHFLDQCGHKGQYRWQTLSHPALHPGQTAALYIKDKPVGVLGALHPSLCSQLDLDHAPYLFEAELVVLKEGVLPLFEKSSKFPAIRRDLAIIVDESIEASQVMENIEKTANQLLKEVKIFDIYAGEGVELGKKSVAMGLVFQEPSRTLVDGEINNIIDRILDSLKSDLGAKLRA